MKNAIHELEIENFKSIKHIKFNPKKVNVFIGKPNVGKSNILEAMALLGESIQVYPRIFYKNIIRYEEIFNLFYDQDVTNNISVNTEKISASIRYHLNNINSAEYIRGTSDLIDKVFSEKFRTLNDVKAIYENFQQKQLANITPDYYNFSSKGEIYDPTYIDNFKVYSFVKYYYFNNELKEFSNKFPAYLQPPYGENLLTILELNKDLLDEIAGYVEEQGLEFVLDKSNNKFNLQKKIRRVVYPVPYSNIADTFRRIIFYLAAIESNKDSVLLFEEPEVHSYPPYIKMLADRVILSNQNQFFISTHSPYMLNTLINGLKSDELNVVLTYYEDYQTKIKVLSDDELAEIQEWNMDVFFNIDRFLNHFQEK